MTEATKTTAASGGISLAQLSLKSAGETPFEFEFIGPDGEPSGIWLKVLGGQSETVVKAVHAAVNERRRAEAVRESLLSTGSPADRATPVETEVKFGQRLAAVRLVGWRKPGETDGLTPEQAARFRGISDAWTPENALLLCETNSEVGAQVLANSNNSANFSRASAKG